MSSWSPETPKLITVLREGYSLSYLRGDLLAGVTVAIVALPLAMALAIASGAAPEKGLVTAVVAGFIISLFSGSRFQIGGPTGAFVVVVYSVIERHGYDGLVLATLMAGVFLILFSLTRLGAVIRFIPHPVITGFTAGIAVIIFSSQMRDLFGLEMDKVPGDFLPKWQSYFDAAHSWSPATLGLALACLAVILILRRLKPRWPGFLIAVTGASLAVLLLDLPVATIGSRYGGIASSLPIPSLPEVSLDRLRALLPDAVTIALLAGIESLLSAMIADGMTGRRHRSNAELMAQGLGNIGSALFGGLPATGAIARTVTNIKSGGRTPVAGMAHAVILLGVMLGAAKLAIYIPLPALAAILVVVAWNMSEADRFRHLLRAPASDKLVLLTTFALTVLIDITVAIEVGIVLAALLFMKRMSEVTEISSGQPAFAAEDEEERPEDVIDPAALPEGVEVFQIRGPFFFAVAGRLRHILDSLEVQPKVFILRMRHAPMMDASGAHAIQQLIDHCERHGNAVVLSGVQPQPKALLERLLRGEGAAIYLAAGIAEALELARALCEGEIPPNAQKLSVSQ